MHNNCPGRFCRRSGAFVLIVYILFKHFKGHVEKGFSVCGADGREGAPYHSPPWIIPLGV